MVRLMARAGVVVLVALLGFVASPRQTDAIFHLAVIDEVLSGYGSDPDVQFVEVRMLASGQEFVNDTRLTAFNADGSSFTVLLLLPNDVANGGVDVRWLMATQEFADLTGLTPDFIFPAGILSPSGMVCWGAPDTAPPSETWDPQFPFLYTDCVAYGDYSGGNALHDPPTDLPPGDKGRSLQRIQGPTGGGDLTDFALAIPSPTNNAGETASMPGVGGIAELPDVAGTPLDVPSSGSNAYQTYAGLAAVTAVGAVTLIGAAWYARRRWIAK